MIRKAIKNSSYFLALLSSGSISKKGPVQKELKIACDIFDEYSESDIYIIPVRLDECEIDHEKIGDIRSVDLFPCYEKGLSQILGVLKPENSMNHNGFIQDCVDEITFIRQVFERFHTKRAVLLLAQAGREQGAMNDNLMKYAIDLFGEKNIIHINPPASSHISMEAYFSALGMQCGVSEGIADSVAFMRIIEDRLVNDKRLFIMITGFEKVNQEEAEELAGVLRRWPQMTQIAQMIQG